MINDNITIDWKEIRLADYGTTYSGLTGKTKDDFGTGKPYIPYLNIFSNTIIQVGDYDYVNITEDETQSLVQHEDLFFTTSSETPEEVGMCSVYKGCEKELYLNSFCFGYRTLDKNAIDTTFLAHFFRSQYGRKIIFKLAQGATRYNLAKKELLTTNFIIPPISEQKRIADCLNQWDLAIAKIKELISQHELVQKWLRQSLLTGRKRLPGYEENWSEISLNEVFSRITRKNTEGNTNVMTVSAQRGFVRQIDFFNKSVASESLVDYFLIEKGQFCYNKSYSNGYDWGATKRLNDFNKAVVTTLYICFKLKNDYHSGDFFEQYFECNLLNKGLTKIAHEGGRAHGLLNVTPHDFFSLKIMIPPKNEQIAISQVLKKAEMELSLLRSKLERIKEQKRGLMQVLLTGEKRFIIK